jgi:2'-5' RNA ligase
VGIRIMRALRWLVPRIFPYVPETSTLSHLAVQPNYRSEVRDSTVEGVGKGLFALETIPAGEVLGEYGGDKVTSLTKWLRLRDKDYLMTTDIPELSLDAARRPEMMMRYVNHHFDKTRLNLIRRAEGERVFYVTSREISPGEEFFVDYGELYWKLRGVDSWHRAPGASQLAIVIPLDEECSRVCKEVQMEALEKYGRNPGMDSHPHITLKMGFPAWETARYEEFIGELAATTKPFDVSMRDFGFFDEGILFLDVEPARELEELRQRILSGLKERHGVTPEPVEGPGFHYHVTLAYGLPKRDFARLREEFSKRQLRLRFRATRLELFRHTGQQWESCNHAALSAGSGPRHDRT